MDKLWLIIKREYLNKVRNRTFIVMTFVSPLITVGVVLLIGWLTSLNSDSQRTIAILDNTAMQYTNLFKNNTTFNYVPLQDISLETAKIATQQAGYYGLLHINDENGSLKEMTFYSKDAPSPDIISGIERKINKKTTEENFKNLGIDMQLMEQAKSVKDLKLETFNGLTTSKQGSWVKIATGGAAGYLLMMFIIIYGNMVMRSVIEEKTNRIIEIIVSSVKPIYLMIGKITGTSLAGITQFAIWVILGGVLITVASFFIGTDAFQNPANADVLNAMQDTVQVQAIVNDIKQLPLLTLIVCFFLFFIGGYFLYASIYTAIGAAVDSETDTQQFMLPVILPLVLSIYVGFFSVMDNPNGTVAVVFSYVPLTSPIVMLMRIPFGGIAWWEIAISLIILYLGVIVIVWVAAKIYRIGILMYGKKTNWKELYKWLKT